MHDFLYTISSKYLHGDHSAPVIEQPSLKIDKCRRRTTMYVYIKRVLNKEGARGGVVVKALRYKPAGRGFDSR